MNIAITFLLLGLAGSALSLPNLGLDTKPVTNAKPGSNKSDDDLLEDVTGVMNGMEALLIRLLELVGCILDEVMDELKLDDEQKSVIRKGFETRVWTDVITTNGHSAHKIVSCLTNAVFNRVPSLIADLEGRLKKDLVKLGVPLDGPQPTHQKKN